jgi:S-adenosylmethionine:tRNA-ribosyltransferase-isomerase (queuine synthetase)
VSHQLADYRFELPQELIASRPPERRRDARMMVVNRAARTWEHRQFTDFAGYVRDGDLVVLNNSRVIRARLFPERPVEEILLLEPLGGTRWRCMVRPGKRMRLGDRCRVAGTVARVVEVEVTGERVIEGRMGSCRCRLTWSGARMRWMMSGIRRCMRRRRARLRRRRRGCTLTRTSWHLCRMLL